MIMLLFVAIVSTVWAMDMGEKLYIF